MARDTPRIEAELIAEIAAYAHKRNWKPSTVCQRAIGNSKLYLRLLNGGSCSLKVAKRLRNYMKPLPSAEEAPVSSDEAAPEAAA